MAFDKGALAIDAGMAFLLLVCASGPADARAQTGQEVRYVSGKGMIACPTPDFAQARAALDAGEDRRLKSSGCRLLAPGLRLTKLEGQERWDYSVPSFADKGKVWRVEVRIDGEGTVTAYAEAEYAGIAPEFLALPAKILLNTAYLFEDEAGARVFAGDFQAVNGADADRVTIEIARDTDPLTAGNEKFSGRKFWLVVARGLTVGEAVEWCGRVKLSKPYGLCWVMVD